MLLPPIDWTTVDLRDYLRTLRKRWAAVVLFVLLAVGAAAAATAATPKEYTSDTTLFVSTRDDSGGIYTLSQGASFTQQRVKDYAQVVNSPAVINAVEKRLKLPPGYISGKNIEAAVPSDTSTLNVVVTDSSPTGAHAVAAGVAAELSRFIPRLETPPGSSVSPVKLTVTHPAYLPAAPSSPKPVFNLALGLVLGLALGVGAAILRETLDTTVKGKEDLQRLTGSAPLGFIADDPDVTQRPLVVHVGAQSARAEAYRQLRTNLQYADIDNPIHSIVVTSSIPGEGKSTTSCNLAITMAEAGLRTVLVEADLRRPKVSHYMGLESAIGLTSVLTGGASLTDALQPWGHHGLWVLPSGPLPPNPSEILGSQHMIDLLKVLLDRADVVVFDAPPLLPVTDAAVLARIVDGAVLVVQAQRTKREQVTRCLEVLQGVDSRLIGTVVNRAPTKGPEADAYGQAGGYGYYAADPWLVGSDNGHATTPRTVVPDMSKGRTRSRSRR